MQLSKQRLLKSVIALLVLFLLNGCLVTAQQKQRQENLSLMQPCPSKRPLSCSGDVVPVCGVFSNGALLNYDSACMACARRTVAGYLPGRCP